MTYRAVYGRLAVKRHRCDGWGCGDRMIPLGAFYVRTVLFNGEAPQASLLCERCAQRYSLSAVALERRKALAEL